MQSIIVACAVSAGALVTAAWPAPASAAEPPTARSTLEIRPFPGPVSGSSFQCAGTWPSALTPCTYPWNSQPQTLAVDNGPHIVELVLRRVPIPVDGGASMVYIDLRFAGHDRIVRATAHETTTQAGPLRVVETSEATGGWIAPSVVGGTADARNAGEFSISFPWGTISGTYDTGSPQ
jgi:hypothetical protein